MMPRGAVIATFASLALAACTPGEFAWRDLPPDLDRYLASFRAAAGTTFVASLPRDELLRRLRAERVLWLGDHHPSGDLHALQNELLAALQRSGRALAFALEAIGTRDEDDVDRFLRGEWSLPELRAALRRRWRGSWLDDPELDPWHYRSLLTFAQKHAVPVVALEPTPRLPIEHRDDVIAAAVRRAAARWPERLLVVHVGQAHLRGDGDLVARTGLGGFVLGAVPPPALARAAPARVQRGELWQSDGDLWWFAELLGAPAGDLPPQPTPASLRATWPSTSSAATR